MTDGSDDDTFTSLTSGFMKPVVLPQKPHNPFERMPRGSFGDPMFADAFRFFVLRLVDSYNTARINAAYHVARAMVDGEARDVAIESEVESRAAIDRAMRYLAQKLRDADADSVARRMGGIYRAFSRYAAAGDAARFDDLDAHDGIAGGYDRPATDGERAAIYREAWHAYCDLVTTLWTLTGAGPFVSFWLTDDVPPDSWLRRSEDAD